jgi:GDP-4-dehydro-6-deoxy-D-mannose reductase
MKVLVTGAHGFVGRWLAPELGRAGHEVVAAPGRGSLDLRDRAAAGRLVRDARPDAIAHLAAISFGPDAERDPAEAFSVSVEGTTSVFEAAARLKPPAAVLVSGSSEVYGNPRQEDLPLRESAPLAATRPYGVTKLEQERVAIRLGSDLGVPTVVTRSFNHTGPGQRSDFVVPALATRVVDAASHRAPTIRAGNVDVQRDISDVRDVVRAYRLLVELVAATRSPEALVVNVCTGRAVAIRDLIRAMAEQAGVQVKIEVDPDLVRADDPPLIVGDPSRIASLTGWHAEIPIVQTITDVLEAARRRPAPNERQATRSHA